jgi:hypothetical protein
MRRVHGTRPLLAILLLLASSTWAGYTTGSGHYVAPYTRSTPHAYYPSAAASEGNAPAPEWFALLAKRTPDEWIAILTGILAGTGLVQLLIFLRQVAHTEATEGSQSGLHRADHPPLTGEAGTDCTRGCPEGDGKAPCEDFGAGTRGRGWMMGEKG